MERLMGKTVEAKFEIWDQGVAIAWFVEYEDAERYIEQQDIPSRFEIWSYGGRGRE